MYSKPRLNHTKRPGLRWQAQRDTAFARKRRVGGSTIVARPKAPSPHSLCRRTPGHSHYIRASTGIPVIHSVILKGNARNFHRRDLLSGRGKKSAGGPSGHRCMRSRDSITQSVLDCGGKRSATPLSHARGGLVVPPSSPARKRRRRIRSACALHDTPVPFAHPRGFQSSTPLASKRNARNFHRRDLLSGRGVKSAGGPPGHRCIQSRDSITQSVLDCGGKRSATPLSHAKDGLAVPPSSPARKRRRRIRSAGALQDTPVPFAHPRGFQSSTPLS